MSLITSKNENEHFTVKILIRGWQRPLPPLHQVRHFTTKYVKVFKITTNFFGKSKGMKILYTNPIVNKTVVRVIIGISIRRNNGNKPHLHNTFDP